MSIYLWITAIAAVVLLLVIILLFRKFLFGKENGLLIFSLILLGILASGGLYLYSSMNGTQVVASKFATEYQIKRATYKDTADGAENYQNTAYAFYTENGIKYRFTGADLLSQPADDPAFIGIYSCEVINGYPWCYIRKGTDIRYSLTDRSHDGNEPADYGT